MKQYVFWVFFIKHINQEDDTIFILICFDKTSDEQKSRYMSRQKQVDLAKERNQKHIGPKEEIHKSKL